MHIPFDDAFVRMVSLSDVCEKYYKICYFHSTHPAERVRVNPRELLAAASGRIELKKLKGPGIAYELANLRDGNEFGFILQSNGSVETFFSVMYEERKQSGRFAILCNRAQTMAGRPLPNPPYIKPQYASLDELITVMLELAGLMDKLIALCGNR